MALQLLDEGNRIEVKDSELDDVKDGDADTVYVVRQIPPAVNKEIGKRHTTTPINRQSGQRDRVIDHAAFMDDLLDYALVDWRGILLKGNPVPCVREHKLLLDMPRKLALLGVAGLNRSASEDRDRSFRSPT